MFSHPNLYFPSYNKNLKLLHTPISKSCTIYTAKNITKVQLTNNFQIQSKFSSSSIPSTKKIPFPYPPLHLPTKKKPANFSNPTLIISKAFYHALYYYKHHFLRKML